jgi:hypothetical protein
VKKSAWLLRLETTSIKTVSPGLRFSNGLLKACPPLPYPHVSHSVRMRAEVAETAEAVPGVGLAVGPVGRVVLEVEAAVALPTTGQRSLGNSRHLSC